MPKTTTDLNLRTQFLCMAWSHPEKIRKEAVRRVEDGERREDVAEAMGLSFFTVRSWTLHVPCNPPPRYSTEIRKEAVRRAKAGEPKTHIAVSLGISYTTIRGWTAHIKIYGRSGAYDEKTKKEAIARVSGGESIRSVCRSMGMSTHAVRIWVRKDPEAVKIVGWDGIRGRNLERLGELLEKGYFFSGKTHKATASDSVHTLCKYVPLRRVQINRRTIYFLESRRHEAMEAFLKRWGRRVIKRGDRMDLEMAFGIGGGTKDAV